MQNGWIKLHRRILESDAWQSNEPFDGRSAWIDLLLTACRENKTVMLGGKAVILNRGSLITSRKKLAERWNWSERKVRTFLSGLEREQQIACQAGNKFSIITVLNYGAYQDKKEAEHMSGQQNDQVSDQQTVQVKPAPQAGGAGFSDQQSDQVSDQQNDHKQEDKEDKEYIISSRARAKQTNSPNEVNQDTLPQEMPIPGGEGEWWPKAVELYNRNIGVITPIIAEQLRELLREVGFSCYERAVIRAVNNGARRYRYIETVARGLAAGVDYQQRKSAGGGDIWGNAFSAFTGGKNGNDNQG